MKTALNYALDCKMLKAKNKRKYDTKAYLYTLKNKNYIEGLDMPKMKNTKLITNEVFKSTTDDLVDLKSIHTDTNFPTIDKIISFLEQIKDPYHFKVGNVTVKVNFKNDGPTFQDKFLNYLKFCSK